MKKTLTKIFTSVFVVLLFSLSSVCINAQSSIAEKMDEIKYHQKDQSLPNDFVINDLYTSAEQLDLQSNYPQKWQKIIDFFPAYDGKSIASKEKYSKKYLMKLFIRMPDDFNAIP